MKKVEKTKQINFTVLYGVVLKKKRDYILIDYYHGKMKIFSDNIEDFDKIEENYTISASGYLTQGWIYTKLNAQQINIFDTKPHHIKL